MLGASSGAAEHRGAFCHRAARGTESCNHGTCATVTAKTPAGRPFLVPMLLTGSWKDRVSSVECGREGVAGILKRLGPGSLRCEYHHVKGGVLADAIGYGKTACTIGLVDKTKARLSRLPSSPGLPRAPPRPCAHRDCRGGPAPDGATILPRRCAAGKGAVKCAVFPGRLRSEQSHIGLGSDEPSQAVAFGDF